MAGGFFSGGSSDSVNASVAEAEAAAREAEAARDEINNKFVEYAGQTDEGSYTVPNADDALTTKFLNQVGDWEIPATAAAGPTELSDLTDVSDTLAPSANQIFQFVGGEWTAQDPSAANELTGTTPITVAGGTISLDDLGVTTGKINDLAVTNGKIADNAVDEGKIDNNSITTDKIINSAVTAAKLSATGTDGQVLSTNADGDLEWATPAAGTVFTASDGVQLVGDDFSLEDGGVDRTKLDTTNTGTDTQVLSRAGDQFTWIDASSGSDDITASNGLVRTGDDISVISTGLTSTQIANDAITTDKILSGNVTSAKIADSAITAVKINDGSVIASKIQDNAVTNGKLADDAVDTNELADGAVTFPKVGALGTPAIGDILTVGPLNTSMQWATPAAGTVYTASDGVQLVGSDFSLATDGVTTAKIEANAITSAKILDNNVTADELNVSGDGNSGNVLSSDGDGSFSWVNQISELNDLTDVHLPSSPTVRSLLEYDVSNSRWNAVAEDEVLTMSQLFDVDFTNIQDNQFIQYNTSNPDGARWENVTLDLASMLTAGAGIDITNDVVSIPTDGIVTSMIIQNAVGSDEIAADAVTTDEILDSAVTTAKIADNAVTAAEIATGTITANEIANNTITAVQLATDSVSSFKLQADSVITSKINDGAVTEPKLAITNTGTDGQVLSRAGSSFTWIANGSGGESYSADGTTLTLSAGNQFSVTPLGIDTASITDAAITEDKLADGAVDTNKIATASINAGRLMVTGNGTSGQVLASDGDGTFSWVNEISVDPNGGLDEDNSGRISIGDDSINSARLADNSVSVDAIIDGVITEPKLNVTNTGTDGQVLSRAGTSFTWIDDAGGTDTTYTAGTGLDLTGTVFSVTNPFTDADETKLDGIATGAEVNPTDAEIVTSAETNTNIAALTAASSPVFTDTTYGNGTGISLSGTTFSINPAVGVSVFTDVATAGAVSGQILQYNGTTWVPVNNNGGGSDTDNSRLVITHVPTSLDSGDAEIQVDVTLSIGNAVIGETITSQSVTVTDPLGNTVAVTGSGNNWMFNASGANVGNYVIRANAIFIIAGVSSPHSTSANLPVNAAAVLWYKSISDTQPSALTDLTSQGAYSSPQNAFFTGAGTPGSTRKAYFAVPTRSNNYILTFQVSNQPLSLPINHGALGASGYDLYEINNADFTDTLTGNLNFIITEA